MSNSQSIAALKSNGECWTWGEGANGQLGNNSLSHQSSPVSVVGAHLFVEVNCAITTFVGLKSNGECWTWGDAAGGMLGDNTGISKSSPVSVVGAHSFIRIASARNHVMALKSNGECWTWGRNTQNSGSGSVNSGQLGDQTVTNRSSPVSVVGGHSFASISAGSFHSIALKADGTVWAWGMNANASPIGQLGDQTGTNRSSPVSVVGGHSFIQISGGGQNSYALKVDGSVWAWGTGTSGALGDNTATSKSSPVSVVGAHSFIQIAGGDYQESHVLALKADGSAWAWGTNVFGKLGDQTVTNRSSPVSVVGGHSFKAVWVSMDSSYGRKADGSVWAWGSNSFGQLGDQTITNRSSPVAVVGTV